MMVVAYSEVGLDVSPPPLPSPPPSPPLDLSFPPLSPSLSHPSPAPLDLGDAAVARVLANSVAVGLF